MTATHKAVAGDTTQGGGAKAKDCLWVWETAIGREPRAGAVAGGGARGRLTPSYVLA